MSDTPRTDKEVKLVGMLREHLVGVGLCRTLERETTALRVELSNAMVLAAEQDAALKAIKKHAEALGLALEDAISTYREDDKMVLVTAERQEAWIHALAEYRGSFLKPFSQGGKLGD